MIKKSMKIDYKQKCIKFEDGKLTDENGEIINLENDLKTIFGNREFTVTATYQQSNEYDVEDFDK